MTDPLAPFLAITLDCRRVALHPAPNGRGGVELRSTAGRVVAAEDYRPVDPPSPEPSKSAARAKLSPGKT